MVNALSTHKLLQALAISENNFNGMSEGHFQKQRAISAVQAACSAFESYLTRLAIRERAITSAAGYKLIEQAPKGLSQEIKGLPIWAVTNVSFAERLMIILLLLCATTPHLTTPHLRRSAHRNPISE